MGQDRVPSPQPEPAVKLIYQMVGGNSVADEQVEFGYPRANLIVSRSGFSVELRAPSAILYAEPGKVIKVFAEMLATPEPKLAVRAKDVRAWQESGIEIDDAERARIIDNIRKAIAFKGWTLVVE